MDILVVTGIWTGASDFFYNGQLVFKGMPAFNNVFVRLLNEERVGRVHIIIWEPQKKIQIPEVYQDKIKIYILPKYNRSLINKFILVFKAVYTGISIVRSNPSIGQIIGFGSVGGITSIVGRLTNIPDFRRVYGSFLFNELHLCKWKLFLRHPLEYLAFSTRGKGLLVTNDGTKGDFVFKKIGSKKLPFYFPINGVNKSVKIKKPGFDIESNYMTYVARIDSWKRQHLLIEALAKLKKSGLAFPHVYIVGAISNLEYAKRLELMVETFGLRSDVSFIRGLPIEEVHYLLKHSMITFSLYSTSNFGNVFIESMQLGVPIIAINDTGSLDLIDKSAFFELRSDNIEGIANSIQCLLEDSGLRNKIGRLASIFADGFFQSWDERVKYEIELMLK